MVRYQLRYRSLLWGLYTTISINAYYGLLWSTVADELGRPLTHPSASLHVHVSIMDQETESWEIETYGALSLLQVYLSHGNGPQGCS